MIVEDRTPHEEVKESASTSNEQVTGTPHLMDLMAHKISIRDVVATRKARKGVVYAII